jgi:hypothetical protein
MPMARSPGSTRSSRRRRHHFPVKQGGLAAQQAAAAAQAVGAWLGAALTPRPFKPVLRGLLFTGDEDRFLRAAIGGGDGDGTTMVNGSS